MASLPDQSDPLLESPKAPRRVKDAQRAWTICHKLDQEDELASWNRRNIHAALDGEVPLDEDKLREIGAPSTNVNFLEGDALRNSAITPFINLTDSVPVIASFDLNWDDEDEANEFASVLAEEFDLIHREWDQFEPNLLMLSDGFVTDGIAAAYWDNEWDWRWKVGKLSDFRLPRNTRIGEDNIKVCTFEDWMSVDELWGYIKDEEYAVGWNIECVRKAIAKSSSEYKAQDSWHRHWDKFQEAIKEGDDLTCGIASYTQVRVKKLWIKEFDGTISLSIIKAAEGEEDYLFDSRGRFKSIHDCLCVFTYGVGNGTYHSVRGLGWKIFPFIKASNKLNCEMLNGTLLAGKVLIQPGDAAAMENMSITSVGPFMVISPGITPLQIPAPNVASQVMPVIGNLSRVLQNNTGQYQSRAVTPEGREMTAREATLQESKESVLSAAAMGLFYKPLGRLWRNSFKKLVNPKLKQIDSGGKEAYEFRRRVLKRGVPAEILSMDKIRRITAVKAIGNGSPSQREMAQDRIMALSTGFDEQGKQFALLDSVAATPGVGYSNAKRYVQPPGKRPPIDVQVASLQNMSFGMGIQQPVLGNDNHYVHATVHLDYLYPVAEQLDAGQMDLQQGLTILNLGLEHTLQHSQALDLDQSRQPEAAAVRKTMQQIGAIAEQQQNKLNAEIRKAQEEQMQMAQQPPMDQGTPPQADPIVDKQAQHEQQLQHKEELFQQEVRHRELASRQQIQTSDLVAAQKIAQENLKNLRQGEAQ